MDNILGRRTRGRNIDFAKAAEDLPEDDEDDEEDDDFEVPGQLSKRNGLELTATNTYAQMRMRK